MTKVLNDKSWIIIHSRFIHIILQWKFMTNRLIGTFDSHNTNRRVEEIRLWNLDEPLSNLSIPFWLELKNLTSMLNRQKKFKHKFPILYYNTWLPWHEHVYKKMMHTLNLISTRFRACFYMTCSNVSNGFNFLKYFFINSAVLEGPSRGPPNNRVNWRLPFVCINFNKLE